MRPDLDRTYVVMADRAGVETRLVFNERAVVQLTAQDPFTLWPMGGKSIGLVDAKLGLVGLVAE